MSTRCNIHFVDYGDICANVYRHSDGYPDGQHGVLANLQQFFSDVEGQTTDTRFSDAHYLASRFVVWQAMLTAPNFVSRPLDFLGVGIVNADAGDGEFIYTVDCMNLKPDGRPVVTHEPA